MNKPSSWIHESELRSQLLAIQAKHLMVIADSCFSGSIYRGTEVIDINEINTKALLHRNLKKELE